MFSEEPMFWQLAERRIPLGKNVNLGVHTPLFMGIVNITPDSFSDGGRFFEKNAALEHALKLHEDGADFLDIGGESTRPGSDPVSEKEELARVVPLVGALNEHFNHHCSGSESRSRPVISVDTSKASVARESLAAGAEVINDISSLRYDPQMLPILQESGAGICVMHMQGNPKTMQVQPQYPNDDPLPELLAFLRERVDFLVSHGVDRSRIAVDPGLGFGKTLRHNLRLVQEAAHLHELNCPVLVGHSRKRFLGELLGNAELDRDSATVLVSLFLAARNTHILRVHNVAAHRQAFDLLRQLGKI